MQEITIYKIRNKEGLYSKGGCSGINFSKRGKTWNNIGHVKSSLCSLIYFDYKNKTIINNIPDDWIVIEMSSIQGIKEYNALELMKYRVNYLVNYHKL